MIVNGKNIHLSELKTGNLQELIDYYQLQSSSIAVEMNGEIVSRGDWSQVTLQDSDKIELIRFVGGG